MPQLLATAGPLRGRAFPVTGAIVLGRDPAAGIVLAETTASRRHTEAAPEGERLRVRDLDSHNGTWVNGQRVKEALLAPGDALTVGDHSFLFLASGTLASTVAPSGPRRFRMDSAIEEFEMVGESPPFRACLATAERLAGAEASILLSGETGTGKELMARWIHRASPRAEGPFVAVNAAAIPESLFEAELFGAEAGAFTGATARRPGKFELAVGGTLFLDEIGELPLTLQPKILRAVQERAFYRVGGTSEVRADVRILAASNRDLAAEARAGRFREDLYHRLSTLVLQIPPLRERREDIPLLARHLAGRTPFSEASLARLQDYPWPGNVRELRNVVERAVVLGIDPLPEAAPAPAAQGFSLAEAERDAVRRALEKTGGRKGEAAKLLGISWPTLRRKIQEHGLQPPERKVQDIEQDVQPSKSI